MLMRTEHDILGEREIPADALWGIHTLRAVENFRLSGRQVHPRMIRAYGSVKLAAARANRAIGRWADQAGKAEAIERACGEMAEGKLDEHILIDALAGGAGTSLNMNVNEVIANRAVQLAHEKGAKVHISPADDVNLHQSTNDTFPTSLKLALMRGLAELSSSTGALWDSLKSKEAAFARVVKVGRTQLQDAVLTTLGREFGAYAAAVGRDRQRIDEVLKGRLRMVNLGGTAIGTGFAAPPAYIRQVVVELAAASRLDVLQAQDMVDATQNQDVFVEVAGVLKTHAATLLKITADLRLMSSGPEAGLCEIALPRMQAGSSIMPGKVNPVVPEAVAQAAMQVVANDLAVTLAAASGNLELNPFGPLIADRLLESTDLLSRACVDFAKLCIDGIVANEAACRAKVKGSTAVATALVSVLGYERVCEIVKMAKETNLTVREAVLKESLISEEMFDQLTSPEAVLSTGKK